MEFLRTSMLIIISLVSTNFFVSGSSSSPHPGNDDFLQCLTDQFQRLNSTTDTIFTPANSSYASLLQSSNLRPTSTSRQRPSVIVTPRHESEIQAAILCSRRVGLQIRVRSGGHDFEGLSYTSLNPFVTVDMRNIRSVSVDAEEQTAWVQAGATLGELYHTIAQESRTLGFSGGICPTVGVGGHMTGGGHGMLSRKYALATDRIIDVILINADGQILNRESMGEDLFWAIRGGGSTSFGVLVAFKIQLVTVPETVTVFNVIRTSEQNATQLSYRYQQIADKFDENLLVKLYLRSVAAADGKRTIAASFPSMYLGPVNDLLPIMRRDFPELGLVEADCTEMSWIESVLFNSGLTNQSVDVLLSREPLGYFTRSYSKATSDFTTRPIPIAALNVVFRFLHEEAENRGELQFNPWGAALSRFSESETAFPHRAGNRFMVYYGVSWDREGNEERERHVNWIRRLYSYMTPYVTKSPRSAYFNYKDLDLGTNNQGNTSYRQASVWGRKYYKNNFDRLVRVKTQVDPSNFFRNEQSIPPLTHTQGGGSNREEEAVRLAETGSGYESA